jgi:dihydrofolate synthase/folylpolyglutamate synthase
LNDASGSSAYKSAVEFLRSRLDFERTPAVAYSEQSYKLDRMAELLSRLGDPQRKLRVVHIAGTKGKGSTASMVAAMLTAAGYRVGVFSSPHLFRVEERMAIDGQPCSATDLAELSALIEPHVLALDAEAERGEQLAQHQAGEVSTAEGRAPLATCYDGGPTYFEITTAMAMLHFARQSVDVAVLEVGLGGRLDSTNVCQPVVSVITSISYDHTRELGPTLTHIAGEKAGIIKPGVPVVSGVTADEPRIVIREKCALEGSPLWELETDFSFTYRAATHLEQGAGQSEIDFVGPDRRKISDIGIKLLGRHQGANAAVALATICRLRELDFDVDDDAVRRGLAAAVCPARVQVLARRPTVILDAAHNVASIQALVETLDESFVARRRYLIFATTRDKDAFHMLRILLPSFDEVLLTRYVSNPRGVPVEDLMSVATAARPELADRAKAYPTPIAALAALREQVGGDDLVCIAGSFFLAADLHGELSNSPLISAR